MPGIALAAPMGTAITYQGRLTDAGLPADDAYDFVFGLYDVSSGGTAVASNVSKGDIPVNDGYFTVQINFGAGAFDGNSRWLQIWVRPGSSTGSYTALSPRQELTPTGYAHYAAKAATADYATTAGSVSGAVGGSGTTNHLAKWLSGSSLGNSVIYETSNRIGIGTTAPDEELVVGSPLGMGWAIPAVTVGGNSGGAFACGNADYRLSMETGPIFGLARVTSSSPSGYGMGDIKFVCDSVQLGTDSTSYRLEVGDPSEANNYIRIGSSSWAGLLFYDGAGSHSGLIQYYHDDDYMKFVTGGASTAEVMRLTSDKQLAVGTTAPDANAKLHVAGDDYYAGYFTSSLTSGSTHVVHAEYLGTAGDGVAVYGESTPVDYYGIGGKFIGGYHGVEGRVEPTGSSSYYGVYGYVNGGTGTNYGSYNYATNGATNYGTRGYATGGTTNYGMYASASGGNSYGIYAVGGTYAGWFVGDVKIDGNLEIYNGATKVLELGTGLDYAEGFDVTEAEVIEAGCVLVIDAANAGNLALSTTAYDTKVAGIVAGANGLGSGVRLGTGQFDHDVALAGRVYCKVDATGAGIEPGDLLTTSERPGYAMKATDAERARGATLGKAMEPLAQGKTGQILVLVTLQ